MNKKHAVRLGALIISAGFMLNNMLPAFACGGGPAGFYDPAAPKTLVFAAFNVVNQQTNGAYDPYSTTWDWEKTWFTDSNMECVAPGHSADRTLTHGYQVNIYVYTSDSHYQTYTFDANEDGTVMFQCTATGPGPRMQVHNG
jgi:hypothetical protein